ncbi:archaetidylserine decarboxylase [Halothiobacillus sp. DCM-1]|uniref:archaetidylserine decarboxylase n=1 Tax=Halothiobacillus sp. DCM-1 TaxID=3112558 RepID=UPI00388DB29B
MVQYALPHHAISRLVYRASRWRTPFTAALIRAFVQRFGVNLAEAAEPDPAIYPSFNAFFTRALRADVRPLPDDPLAWVSPCDGVLSQFGLAQSGNLIQAKGRDYTVAQLLGGDVALAEQFGHSHYATIYLSPKDYHRVHMPVAGRLVQMIHVPGRLFSVSPATVQQVPELLARNERLVCVFETDWGLMALVLVGAINVAAIETVWAGVVTPPAGQGISSRRYGADTGMQIALDRGQEMGRFNLGSTVVMLLPSACQFASGLFPGMTVKMGQALGGCAQPVAE